MNQSFPSCIHGIVGVCHSCDLKTVNERIDDIEKWAKELHVDYHDIKEIHRVLNEHYHNIFNRDPQGLKDRINNIDSALQNHWQRYDANNKWLQERISELEKWKEVAIEKNIQDIQRIRDLEEITKRIHEDDMKSGRTPYKCPVCEGCGNDKGIIRQNTDYEFCMQYASCHSCEGEGIVWG
jgi:hypothetical protein